MALKRLARRHRSGSKKRNHIIHFDKRCLKRADIDINPNQYQQLINKIQKGKATLIKSNPDNKTSVWEVSFEGGLILKVVYDKGTHLLKTVLNVYKNTISDNIRERG